MNHISSLKTMWDKKKFELVFTKYVLLKAYKYDFVLFNYKKYIVPKYLNIRDIFIFHKKYSFLYS